VVVSQSVLASPVLATLFLRSSSLYEAIYGKMCETCGEGEELDESQSIAHDWTQPIDLRKNENQKGDNDRRGKRRKDVCRS